MAWLVLVGSAVLEAVWAVSLGMSDGFRLWLPSLIFLVTTVLSMIGLGWAVRTIPVGTAYAVWTGLGAALTAAYSMLFGAEPITSLKLLFLTGIVGAAIGLKLVSARDIQGAPKYRNTPILSTPAKTEKQEGPPKWLPPVDDIESPSAPTK